MRILLIKLSSMGDIIQALPALSDAHAAIENLQIDWAVDESFAEIPHWHPAVCKTVESAHRRWKRSFFHSSAIRELRQFRRELRESSYDAVIDAQGNLKSAAVCALSRGRKHGLDAASTREAGASWFYHQTYAINRQQLSIERWRQLFAQALGYTHPGTAPDFGLQQTRFELQGVEQPDDDYLVYVHNASWPSKLWTVQHWRALAELANQNDKRVLLPWGSRAEKQQAEAIASGFGNAEVLPALNLSSLAALLKNAEGAICMDTGLAHLAAALGTPTITLYGPTDPGLIGATGENSRHVFASDYPCRPCYKRSCKHEDSKLNRSVCLNSLDANRVWETLLVLNETGGIRKRTLLDTP